MHEPPQQQSGRKKIVKEELFKHYFSAPTESWKDVSLPNTTVQVEEER
jgi:hypothetical protein